MDGAAARREAEKILAEPPDRVSDVIKPFARQSPDYPALAQGDVTWTYAELAAIRAHFGAPRMSPRSRLRAAPGPPSPVTRRKG
jgi:hypothetical protein